jgi:oligopeptide/dipeptide ABC transporter ATP-binding protein
MRDTNQPLIDVQNLKVYFPIKSTGLFGKTKGWVRAVDDVSFFIRRGETLGLVGESGSGKTTIGRAILRALAPTEGQITFFLNGEAIRIEGLRGRALAGFRRHMQLIFQDPYASLNPRMTVRDIIAEPLECQKNGLPRKDIDEQVRKIAEKCKLNVQHLRRFPHAFSGGQRQRICIARALVSNPQFIVCDESVSALDVSIQAEILNLLKDLQDYFKVAYLFIAHDLSVVALVSTRVAVMYVGRLVELAASEKIFFSPKHPYTHALLSAVPTVDIDREYKPVALKGEIPNPANPPLGCRFNTRCPYVDKRCREKTPDWREIEPEHYVACHYAENLNLMGAFQNQRSTEATN